MNLELSMIENEIEKIQNQYNISSQQRSLLSQSQNNRRQDDFLQNSNISNQSRLSNSQNRRSNSIQDQNNQLGSSFQRLQNSRQYDQYNISNPQVNDSFSNNQLIGQTAQEFNENGVYPLNDQEQMLLSELLQRSHYSGQPPVQQIQKQRQNNQHQNLTSSSIFLMPKNSNQSISQDGIHQQEMNDPQLLAQANHIKLQPLNFTMNQTTLSNNGAFQNQSPDKSPSQAALSALRALQDKIKEVEKENMELKHQLGKNGTQVNEYDDYKRQIKILSTQLGMVEDEKRRHLEMNAIEKSQLKKELDQRDSIIEGRERLIKELVQENKILKQEINQTKNNLQEIHMVIKQIKSQSDEDQEALKLQYKNIINENEYIRANYDKLKKTYQKELSKRSKTDGKDQSVILKLESKLKSLSNDNHTLKDKIRFITEDLRYFQNIYGNKVKRRQNLRSQSGSKDQSLSRNFKQSHQKRDASLQKSSSHQRIPKPAEQIKPLKSSLKRSKSSLKSLASSRQSLSKKDLVIEKGIDNIKTLRNLSSSGYSPVQINIPQVRGAESFFDLANNDKHSEYYENLNERLQGNLNLSQINHSQSSVRFNISTEEQPQKNINDQIFHLEREISELQYKYKNLLDICEKQGQIQRSNQNAGLQESSLHKIRMEVSSIADNLESKEEQLQNLKSLQMKGAKLQHRNHPQNQYILIGDNAQYNSGSMISSTFRTNN